MSEPVYSQCQELLDNSMQCCNNAWGQLYNQVLCRLHFSVELAKIPDVSVLGAFDAHTINPNDSPDLAAMLDHRAKAQVAVVATVTTTT
jgi:hypothetical protein